MKTLILGLADKAEPLEASALREVAQNYSDAVEAEPKAYELRFKHLLWIVLAVYAIWTPVYFFSPHEATEPPPEGRRVEQLSGFVKTPDGRYTARTYRFARGEIFVDGARQWTYFEDPAPLVVYEGRSPLPKESYELQELLQENIWRFVTIKTDSDPNKNGRRYFIVLP